MNFFKKEIFKCFDISTPSLDTNVRQFVHLNFNCAHDHVVELRHIIYITNLSIGIPWGQRTAHGPTVAE